VCGPSGYFEERQNHGIAEVVQAGDLLKRIKRFDPRNSKRFVAAAMHI
jgi:hypothetical protein